MDSKESSSAAAAAAGRDGKRVELNDIKRLDENVVVVRERETKAKEKLQQDMKSVQNEAKERLNQLVENDADGFLDNYEKVMADVLRKPEELLKEYQESIPKPEDVAVARLWTAMREGAQGAQGAPEGAHEGAPGGVGEGAFTAKEFNLAVSALVMSKAWASMD